MLFNLGKKIISTTNAPAAIGPYSQAVKLGPALLTSGQLGIDPATGELPEGVKAQTEQSMRNIGALLHEAGLDYSNVIKTTVFVKDLKDFAVVNEVYASFFTGDYPARSCVQVAALPKDALVEIEVIAMP